MPCIVNLYYQHLEICQRSGILGHKAGHLKTQRYAKHELHASKSHPNYFTFTKEQFPWGGEGKKKKNHLINIMQATYKLFNPV